MDILWTPIQKSSPYFDPFKVVKISKNLVKFFNFQQKTIKRIFFFKLISSSFISQKSISPSFKIPQKPAEDQSSQIQSLTHSIVRFRSLKIDRRVFQFSIDRSLFAANYNYLHTFQLLNNISENFTWDMEEGEFTSGSINLGLLLRLLPSLFFRLLPVLSCRVGEADGVAVVDDEPEADDVALTLSWFDELWDSLGIFTYWFWSFETIVAFPISSMSRSNSSTADECWFSPKNDDFASLITDRDGERSSFWFIFTCWSLSFCLFRICKVSSTFS